jgi:hypothetical protein
MPGKHFANEPYLSYFRFLFIFETGSHYATPGWPGICSPPSLPSAGITCVNTPGFVSSFFFFLVGLGFEFRASHIAKQVLYCLSHTSSSFCCGYFEDMVLWTICQGWHQTAILISASQVARLTSVSHWCLASISGFKWGHEHLLWEILWHLSYVLSFIQEGLFQ